MSGLQDSAYDWSEHARDMLVERDVPVEWIERAVTHPELTLPHARDPELRHALRRMPEYEGRVLRVVYNHTVSPWRIVTFYFDRGMRDRL